MPDTAGRPDTRTKQAIPTFAAALHYTWRVAKLMRPYWPRLAKGTFMGLGLGLLGMIMPYISKLYFDRVYPSHDVTLLEVLVVGAFVLTATNALLAAIKSYYSATVSAQLTQSMSLMFFNHLQHLTVRFFDEHRVGEVMSRFQDIRTSFQTVSSIFDTIMTSGTFLVLVPPLLLFMNFKLALISLTVVPLTTVVSTVSSHWVRRFSK
jgi:ABC-type bacteriocin/lantibiotic exporter with double-glycine peptidase domain